MAEFCYWTMVACFFTHELDAVRRHEWRLLSVVRRIPDKLAERVFIWLHAPLFLAILWFSREGALKSFTVGLALFAVVHVGLHWIFRKHPNNEFDSFGSRTLIILPGFFGTLYVILQLYR